jgi:DNA-binding transcriptional ArsR family regulator
MGAGIDLEELGRRGLRPLVDVHASAVMLATEAVAVGPGEPWSASILDRLGAVHRRALRPMAMTGLVPDVVLDVEHHGRGLKRRLEGIAQAQPRDLVAELASDWCPLLATYWREAVNAPERWLAAVAVAVSRVLPVAQGLLAADRAQLKQLVRRIDAADEPAALASLLEELHPRAEVANGRWEPPRVRPARTPAVEGLLVLPALATPEWTMFTCREQTVTMLLAGVSSRERDHVALTTLLGSTRATLLRILSRPRTMTELADQLSLVASAVSYHVTALERMQLVTRSRRGRSVTVARSTHGAQLLALYGAHRLSGRHDPSVVSALAGT